MTLFAPTVIPSSSHPPPPPNPSTNLALELALAALDHDERPPQFSSAGSSRSTTSDSISSLCSSSTRRSRRRSVDRHSDGKMRAAYISRHGPPHAVFRIAWIDRPTPALLQQGQLLVRVHAAAVSGADATLRNGDLRRVLPLPFPAVLGTDFAGVVQHVGPGVHGNDAPGVGDRVYGRACMEHGFGSYAEYAIVSVARVARMPAGVTFSEAAAIPTVSLTALAALSAYAQLRAGERVLVFGGTSGVGHVALQLARARGASAVCTTCSPRNEKFVRELGATKVYDYHELTAAEIVRDARPDVVLDTSGSSANWAAVQAMASGARFVMASGSECLGALAGASNVGYSDVLDITAKAAGRKALSKMKIGPGYHLVMPSALDAPLERITRLVEDEDLKVVVFKEFALGDIAKAHSLRERKRPRGKIVIRVAAGDL